MKFTAKLDEIPFPYFFWDTLYIFRYSLFDKIAIYIETHTHITHMVKHSPCWEDTKKDKFKLNEYFFKDQ